ncbi:MAG: hypothetical protein QNJ19_07705 [Woeseiaceae bacterium]|nr:hypothetical protein [Woeseiaceae bacterium]
MNRIVFLLLACVAFNAASANETRDIFKGKLFPPNVVLENRGELDLTREQYTAIRAAVVEVQTQVAEHEWDMQEAYTSVLESLDERPLDEQQIISNVKAVLAAENKVKLAQMGMLIRIRNLLSDEQIEFLESNWSESE